MKKTITILLAAIIASAATSCSTKNDQPGDDDAGQFTIEATPTPPPTPAPTSPPPTTTPTLTPMPLPPTIAPKPEDWKTEEKARNFDYDIDNLNYELVWSDEFDYEGIPDPDKWNYDIGGSGWGNNELQFYTYRDNVWVDGEKMIIEARAEEKAGRDVTSTRIITKNKGDWLYGKIEVRAKLPSGLGTWPAIWMLPTDWEYGNWPASGEIDIMEHVGYDQDVIVQTVHTEAYNHSINTQRGSSVKVEGVSTDFHVYSIEWLPDKILFFVDGVENFVFEPQKIITSATYKHWPFDKRHHLLINIAFGGSWGGARGVDIDVLPATMEIDYVRVYQAPELDGITPTPN